MSNIDYQSERQAHMLAGKIQSTKEMLRTSLAPAGQRPPFTEQLSQGEALNWWRQHRNDEYGKQMVSKMGQQDVMELDAALMQAGVPTNGTASGSGIQI